MQQFHECSPLLQNKNMEGKRICGWLFSANWQHLSNCKNFPKKSIGYRKELRFTFQKPDFIQLQWVAHGSITGYFWPTLKQVRSWWDCVNKWSRIAQIANDMYFDVVFQDLVIFFIGPGFFTLWRDAPRFAFRGFWASKRHFGGIQL